MLGSGHGMKIFDLLFSVTSSVIVHFIPHIESALLTSRAPGLQSQEHSVFQYYSRHISISSSLQDKQSWFNIPYQLHRSSFLDPAARLLTQVADESG